MASNTILFRLQYSVRNGPYGKDYGGHNYFSLIGDYNSIWMTYWHIKDNPDIVNIEIFDIVTGTSVDLSNPKSWFGHSMGMSLPNGPE